MPKIICNVKEQIIAETGRQLRTAGYSGLTIRSVAEGCRIAVGTVYNYFPSKDIMIASFMLEEWKACTEQMNADIEEAADTLCVLEAIHTSVTEFIRAHETLFRSPDARKAYIASSRDYHPQLRKCLAALIESRCENAFTADFLAEALLCWTVEGVPFSELKPILERIIQ